MTPLSTKALTSRDELIEEVREIRAKISARFDNDVNKLCEHLREVEKQYPHRIVRLSPPPAERKG